MSADYLKGLHNKKAREVGERYGIKHSDYGFNRPGSVGIQKKNPMNYGSDVAKAAMNDYDTRRTIEAAAMSGKKKAQKIAKKGFSNLDDVTKANNMFEKMHDRRGNGGDFSSAKDYAGLTHSMVQRDREKQTAGYEDKFTQSSDLNALKEKMMAQATAKAARPIEPSDRMAAVEDRLKGAASNTPPGLYANNNESASKADDQKDAARSFLDGYKFDVTKGAGLKHDIETSVSNAARHVTDVYGR